MRDVNIEGKVNPSSRERWTALIGGILFIPCGPILAYFVFTNIPISIFIPHMCAIVLSIISTSAGLSLILLAIRPEKEYIIQNITEVMFR